MKKMDVSAFWQKKANIASSEYILDPSVQKFVDSFTAKENPPLYTMTPEKARAILLDIQSQPTLKLPVEIDDRILPMCPEKISIRIIRPCRVHGPLPVILYFHGGGWMLGDKNTHDRLIRELAVGAHASVIFISYNRTPEFQFPSQIEQLYAITKYIAEHPNEFNIDSKRIAIAGDSVGGNMCIAVALLAKEYRSPHICFQLLFYPVTNANFDTPSYKTFADGPWLTKDTMKWFWNAYTPNSKDRKKITVSPLCASIEELRNLPQTLIITDENDVLRDEGEAFARKLLQAGVPTITVRYIATIHDFVMLNPLATSPITRSAIDLATLSLRRAFKT